MKAQKHITRNILCALMVIVCIAIFAACTFVPEAHTHEWSKWTVSKEPTCTVAGEESRTCRGCGEKETRSINVLEHKWNEPTCTSPKTCSVCDATEGEALGHEFTDATCTSPKTCGVCGMTEGEALEHDFADATTEAPKTCKLCGATEGEPLPDIEEPADEEEPNWFVKMINAILDFFRRLFRIEKRK